MTDLKDPSKTFQEEHHSLKKLNQIGFILNDHGSIHIKVCWIVPMNTMPLRNILCVSFLMIWLQCATGLNLLFSCDFGTSTRETFCGMVQGVDDDFDWKLTSSSGKADTGPSQDHTGNPGGAGRFLWADSYDGGLGQKAIIASPPFNLTGDEGWLTFWYHLYGDGSLSISVCQSEGPVLTLDGNQQNEWHEQNMTVSCGENPVQITFTSTRNSMTSDVGLDDIYLYHHILKTTTEPLSPPHSSSMTTPSMATSPTVIASSSIATSPRIVTSFQTTVQSPLPFTEKFSESYKELAIGVGVVALLLFVFGAVITFLYIKLRITVSKMKLEQLEKPYMDLVPTGTSPTYETMATDPVSKVGESSYENQTVVKQHQHINQITVGDEYEYELSM